MVSTRFTTIWKRSSMTRCWAQRRPAPESCPAWMGSPSPAWRPWGSHSALPESEGWWCVLGKGNTWSVGPFCPHLSRRLGILWPCQLTAISGAINSQATLEYHPCASLELGLNMQRHSRAEPLALWSAETGHTQTDTHASMVCGCVANVFLEHRGGGVWLLPV